MNKDFIPFELALELKQLGFDEPCFAKYFLQDNKTPFVIIGEFEILEAENAGDDMSFACSCPTYAQAFRWFRENHNINAWIINAEDNHNVFKPFFRGANIHDQHLVDFYKTYEEAELACLKKLIEILKGGNK